MTPPFGPHLSTDEVDAWLVGALAPDAGRHLAGCPDCQERATAERELVSLLASLPLLSPAPGFADRVMTQVRVPQPLAARALHAVRRRVLATPRTAALAASLLVAVVASMTASVVWTLGHQATLVAVGSWLSQQAAVAAWLGVRGIASNLIEQPWFAWVKVLATRPGGLAAAATVATLVYLGGVLALRRLLALPAQQVAHAGA